MNASQADRLLRGKGYATRKAWAVEHHYSPNTVNTVFRRWLGHVERNEQTPRGVTSKILQDLSSTLDRSLIN